VVMLEDLAFITCVTEEVKLLELRKKEKKESNYLRLRWGTSPPFFNI
jgi:hypothetical protein